MLKVKKQYKQPDGTLIEVEGTPAEIESYEKKQRALKDTIDENSKKKTVLYGKDLLDEFRRMLEEELAKRPPEYRWITTPAIPMPTYPLVPTYNVCPWCGQWNCHQSHVICTNAGDTLGGSVGGAVVSNTYAIDGNSLSGQPMNVGGSVVASNWCKN